MTVDSRATPWYHRTRGTPHPRHLGHMSPQTDPLNPFFEIEKKWLILPRNQSLYDSFLHHMRSSARENKTLEQGYIRLEGSKTIRLRSFGNQPYIAYKESVPNQTSVVRNEWEQKIPQFVFDALWPNTANNRIIKERMFVDLVVNNKLYTFEVDFFKGHLYGLILVECEFSSVDESFGFELPDLFIPADSVSFDVTETTNGIFTNDFMSNPSNLPVISQCVQDLLKKSPCDTKA